MLVKHVLSSITIHVLAGSPIPKGGLQDINRILANFIWNDKEENHKHHWVAWHHIALPIDEGGLGIREFSDLSKAPRMKLGWKILKN